jgi:hypothetical protein
VDFKLKQHLTSLRSCSKELQMNRTQIERRRRHPLLRKTLVLPCEIKKCICAFCSRKSLLAYFWSQKAQHFSISQSDCECFSSEDGCSAAAGDFEVLTD